MVWCRACCGVFRALFWFVVGAGYLFTGSGEQCLRETALRGQERAGAAPAANGRQGESQPRAHGDHERPFQEAKSCAYGIADIPAMPCNPGIFFLGLVSSERVVTC